MSFYIIWFISPTISSHYTLNILYWIPKEMPTSLCSPFVALSLRRFLEDFKNFKDQYRHCLWPYAAVCLMNNLPCCVSIQYEYWYKVFLFRLNRTEFEHSVQRPYVTVKCLCILNFGCLVYQDGKLSSDKGILIQLPVSPDFHRLCIWECDPLTLLHSGSAIGLAMLSLCNFVFYLILKLLVLTVTPG